MSLPFPYSNTAQVPYPQAVMLKGTPRYEEAFANATYIPFSPGYLLAYQSDGTIGYHNVKGGSGPTLIAALDTLQGGSLYLNCTGGVSPPYAPSSWYSVSGQFVPYYEPKEGDEFLVWLPVGFASTFGDILMSNGDGTLVPLSANFPSGLVYSYIAGPSAALTGALTTAQPFTPTYTLTAGQYLVGDVIKIRFQALVTGHHAGDTLAVILKIGTHTIITTGAITNAANDIIVIDAYVTVQSIGASGSIVAEGMYGSGAPGTVTDLPFSLGPTSFDTTVSEAIAVTATWGNSPTSASTVVAEVMDVEITRIAPLAKLMKNRTLGTTDNTAGTYPVPIYATVY